MHEQTQTREVAADLGELDLVRQVVVFFEDEGRKGLRGDHLGYCAFHRLEHPDDRPVLVLRELEDLSNELLVV